MRKKRRGAGRKRARPEEEPPRAARGADAAGVGALVLLHLAFFWRAALLRGFLVHSDICYQFEPLKALLHESLRAGRLPLWSPYIMCGYPVAAEGQIAAFYPPSLLISWLLPSPGAINWLIISHLLLAAVSMYLLGRVVGLSPFGAWLSGLVFSFSGYLFGHLHHVGLICAAAWLPLTIVFIERACRGAVLPNAPLAAVTWAAAALCGHPQTVFLISLTAVFWVGWRLPRGEGGALRLLRRGAAVLAITFLLGGGLAAVQLLLTAELSASAPHGESGDLAYITSFSLLPKHLVGLVAPNWQGSPAFNSYRAEGYYWEYVLYLGLVPLALACIGGAGGRGRVLGGLALVALVLALAQGNPLYRLLRLVPGFADFRGAARFVFLFTFSAALLAGQGWETISSRWLRPLSHRVPLGIAIGLLSLVDLFHFDLPLAPLAGPEVYSRTPGVVQVLREEQEWGRSLIVPPMTVWADWLPAKGWAGDPDGWLEARVYLPADVPQSFELRTIKGYVGFVDRDHARFFDAAYWEAMPVLLGESRSPDLGLLSLLGARQLAVATIAIPPGEKLVWDLPRVEAPPFDVYRNPDAFGRVFVIGQIVECSDSEDAFRRTVELARAGRLREVAVVQGEVGEFPPDGQPKGVLRVRQLRPEHVVVEAESEGPALLVLNERYDGGWRVRLDGRPAALLEVDSVLMGAALPAGTHTVEFAYRPRGLVVGRAVSLASVVVWALLVAWPCLLRRGGRGPEAERA